jgi:hypothetical protein
MILINAERVVKLFFLGRWEGENKQRSAADGRREKRSGQRRSI